MGSRFADPLIRDRIENGVIHNGCALIIIKGSLEIWQVNDTAP